MSYAGILRRERIIPLWWDAYIGAEQLAGERRVGVRLGPADNAIQIDIYAWRYALSVGVVTPWMLRDLIRTRWLRSLDSGAWWARSLGRLRLAVFADAGISVGVHRYYDLLVVAASLPPAGVGLTLHAPELREFVPEPWRRCLTLRRPPR